MSEINIKDLSNIIFDFESDEKLKEYEKLVLGQHTFTLKQQFIAYCFVNGMEPKFDRQKTKRKAGRYLKKFLEVNKVNKEPDFSVFDDLLFVDKLIVF